MMRTILLVEPDEEHRIRVARSLDATTLRVAGETTDPDEAMRLAAMTRPDLAMVATDLHRMDGTQLASRLATEHGIPSLLLSDAGDRTAISRAAESGAMGFLVRPVDPGALHAMTEVALSRFREIRALRREGEELRRTLEARKVIERAKGLLMEMEGMREQEAFARLRQKSMDTQRPMAEIARAVILAAEVGGRTR